MIDWLHSNQLPLALCPINLTTTCKYQRDPNGSMLTWKARCSLWGDTMQPNIYFYPNNTTSFADYEALICATLITDASELRQYVIWTSGRTSLITYSLISMSLYNNSSFRMANWLTSNKYLGDSASTRMALNQTVTLITLVPIAIRLTTVISSLILALVHT